MKALKAAAVVAAAVFATTISGPVYATDDPGTVKQELDADKAAIKAQKAEMKAAGQAARAEEKAIRSQIKEARQSGDTATADSLKAQLKETHKENVSQMKQDKKELGGMKKEMRRDHKAAGKGRGMAIGPKGKGNK
jgi:hypothetical protein